MEKIIRKLREKRGSGFIWGVAMLLAGIMLLAAILIISTTFAAGDAVKSQVRGSAESVLNNSYLAEMKGYANSALSASDILDFMAQNYGLQITENGGTKLDANGNRQYSISGLSVTEIANRGEKARTLQGFRVSFTFSRPVVFGGRVIPDASIPMNVYVWHTPKQF